MFSEEKKERAKKASVEYYHRNKEARCLKNKEWRLINKGYVLEQQRLYKRERKLQSIAYLGGKCQKCSNEYHPSVYEFHHRDPEDKDRDPSKMLSLSWERLEAELNKCDLLCANCHRLVHHENRY